MLYNEIKEIIDKKAQTLAIGEEVNFPELAEKVCGVYDDENYVIIRKESENYIKIGVKNDDGTRYWSDSHLFIIRYCFENCICDHPIREEYLEWYGF